jgi:diguanylate cyclase (GGDEF)-like protein
LVVLLERDDQARELYTEYLVGEGYRVRAEALFDDAISALGGAPTTAGPVTGSGSGAGGAKRGGVVPLVIAGIAPGGATVAQIATAIRRASPYTALLALLGRDAMEGTLRAVRDGALEALAKPVTAEALAASVKRCLETVQILGRHPEMRQAVFAYQAARRLQRASDPGTLAEQLLDVCLHVTGADAGTVLRPGDGTMDVHAVRHLDEAGARELAGGLDFAALQRTPGIVVLASPPSGSGVANAANPANAANAANAGNAANVASVASETGAGAAASASPGRGRGKTVAQVAVVRVGEPGSERLWVALVFGQKSHAAWQALSAPARATREGELLLYTSQALLAIDVASRWPDGAEPSIDPLTDLVDARSLERAVGHEVQLARRSERPVTVMALELGRLDELHAQHGELAAGQSLIEAARLVTRSVRDVDLVARTGPQQFGVLLAGSDKNGGARVAERLRHVFSSHRFLAREGLDAQLALGVGVAVYPADGKTAAELLAAAGLASRGQPAAKAARRRAKSG